VRFDHVASTDSCWCTREAGVWSALISGPQTRSPGAMSAATVDGEVEVNEEAGATVGAAVWWRNDCTYRQAAQRWRVAVIKHPAPST
jgi:hypothetical protein